MLTGPSHTDGFQKARIHNLLENEQHLAIEQDSM